MSQPKIADLATVGDCIHHIKRNLSGHCRWLHARKHVRKRKMVKVETAYMAASVALSALRRLEQLIGSVTPPEQS